MLVQWQGWGGVILFSSRWDILHPLSGSLLWGATPLSHPWQVTVLFLPLQGQGGVGLCFCLLHLLLELAPRVWKSLSWLWAHCFSINHPWILRGTSAEPMISSPSIVSCRGETYTEYAGGNTCQRPRQALGFCSGSVLSFARSRLWWTVAQAWKTSQCYKHWILLLPTRSPRSSSSTQILAHLFLSWAGWAIVNFPFSQALLIALTLYQQIFTHQSKLVRSARASFSSHFTPGTAGLKTLISHTSPYCINLFLSSPVNTALSGPVSYAPTLLPM